MALGATSEQAFEFHLGQARRGSGDDRVRSRVCTLNGWFLLVSSHAGNTHQVVHAELGQCDCAGALHVHKANAYQSRLKGWMSSLHVVADLYLINYFGCSCILEQFSGRFTVYKKLLSAQCNT